MTCPNRADFILATDADRMRPVFAENLKNIIGGPVNIESFYVTRAYPRNDGGFSIQYEINTEKSEKTSAKKLLLWGHLLAPSQPIPHYIASGKQQAFFFEDIRLAVPVFPYDPKLKRLGDYFGTGEKSRQKLRSVPFLKNCDFDIIDCGVLGYRLERRCVLRYTVKIGGDRDIEKKQLVVKVCRPAQAAKILEISRTLCGSGFGDDSFDGLTVPRIYAVDEESGAIFMEAAPGDSLHSYIENPVFYDYCHDAGRILAKFHSMPLEHIALHSVSDELENLRGKVDLALEIFPASKGSFSDAFDKLAAHEPGSDFSATCVHRDFYDKQILFSPKRITLLDYDGASVSDPALDYGNFTAHLALRGLQSPDSSTLILGGLPEFVRGYDIADKGFKRRARWWRAAALIRLAVLYSFRPRWRTLAEKLLREANSSFRHNEILSGEKV